jgi:hypothetical protein
MSFLINLVASGSLSGLSCLTPNFREVIVVRTCDGVVKGHIFVHGCATCVSVGADDRTIIVGCEDGRVMILTVILELCDPVHISVLIHDDHFILRHCQIVNIR